MSALPLFASIALLGSAIAANASTHGCALVQIEPIEGRLVIDGAQDALLGEADNSVGPSAWQGPITSGRCTVDLGIIEAPFFAVGKGKVYVTTYSGSARNVVLVDLEACKVTWRSKPFTGEVTVTRDGLKMGARQVRTNAQCIPVPKR